MKREEIVALADLARIELTDAETESFSKEFDAILEYVASVKGLAGESAPEPRLGAVANVLREDEHPHAPDLYTEDLLNEAPDRHGRYVRVKKILGS